MVYEQTVWRDGQRPALEAANLNKIEAGIKGAEDAIGPGVAEGIAEHVAQPDPHDQYPLKAEVVPPSAIWVAGSEALTPLVSAYEPVTGRLVIGGIEMGDTGWRDITASLTGEPSWVNIRRVGLNVSVIGVVDTATGTRTRLPSGFRPARTVRLPTAGSGTAVAIHLVWDNGDWNTGTQTPTTTFSITWPTENPWPTSLPGVPV